MSTVMPRSSSPIPAETRFGKLVVIEPGAPFTRGDKRKMFTSLCKCDCGNKATVLNCNLLSGATKTCGCQRKRIATGRKKVRVNVSLAADVLEKAKAVYGDRNLSPTIERLIKEDLASELRNLLKVDSKN